MTRAIRMLVLLFGLWGGAAVAQQGAPAAGPQPANILEATRDDQAARQQVQPLNNAPVWREVNSPSSGFTNLPANEGGVLIQSAGEDWRQLRNGPVTQYGGWGLVVVLLVIAAYYLLHGSFKVSAAPTGRLIERFTLVERATHWLNFGAQPSDRVARFLSDRGLRAPVVHKETPKKSAPKAKAQERAKAAAALAGE